MHSGTVDSHTPNTATRVIHQHPVLRRESLPRLRMAVHDMRICHSLGRCLGYMPPPQPLLPAAAPAQPDQGVWSGAEVQVCQRVSLALAIQIAALCLVPFITGIAGALLVW